MKNSFLWRALSIFFSFTVVGIIVWILVSNWQEIVTFPWHLDFAMLALSLITHSIAFAFTYWVWHLMIKRMSGFDDKAVNFRFYYISSLAKRIPTSVPYIGSYLLMYRQVGVPVATVMNCVILEIVLISIAGMVTFVSFVPFYSTVAPLNAVIALSVIGFAITLFLMMKPRFLIDLTNRLLRRFGQPEQSHAPSSRDLLSWIGYYIFAYIFSGFSLYFALRGLSTQPGPDLIQAVTISTLATLISILNLFLPGGLALKELAMSTLLTPWMPISTALVISMVYRLLHTANEIVWALIAAGFPRSRTMKTPQTVTESLTTEKLP